MRRSSSILSQSIPQGSIVNWVVVALAMVAFAGALLAGCDRTISDDASWLPESIQ